MFSLQDSDAVQKNDSDQFIVQFIRRKKDNEMKIFYSFCLNFSNVPPRGRIRTRLTRQLFQ